MYNPHCLLTKELLEGFSASGQKYFIRQEFKRGMRGQSQRSFLVSHYRDYSQAFEHFEAIAHDPLRFFYRWSESDHRRRLLLAAGQPAGFLIYACVVMPDWQEKAGEALKNKVKNYVEEKIAWYPGRKDGIDFELYPHFGEVFVRMRFRKQEIKVSLAEVENFS